MRGVAELQCPNCVVVSGVSPSPMQDCPYALRVLAVRSRLVWGLAVRSHLAAIQVGSLC